MQKKYLVPIFTLLIMVFTGGLSCLAAPEPLLGEGNVYMHGYANQMFKPNQIITRAEVSVSLYNLIEEKPEVDTSSQFKDTLADTWYSKQVNALVALGALSGYANGTFKPHAPITRAELVTVLTKIYGTQLGGSSFPDVATDYWAYETIITAKNKSWVAGYPDGTFRPNANLTRAEFTVMINNVTKRDIAYWTTWGTSTIFSPSETFQDVERSDWYFWHVMEATRVLTSKKYIEVIEEEDETMRVIYSCPPEPSPIILE